jgi:ferredoxin--NADP+ reductase
LVLPAEATLDVASQAFVSASTDHSLAKKVDLLQHYARQALDGKTRRLHIRFLVSPTELIGDEAGQVVKMRLVKNVLVADEKGGINAQATDQFEELPVGLVFRSVGYRGVALPDVPFHERWGVILNEHGRVLDPSTKQPRLGEYTSGWIKRGPSGIIGTNRPDALETVQAMLADVAQERVLDPVQTEAASVEALVRERQPQYFTYADWHRLDALEIERGAAQGRPRVKFVSVEEMLAALGRG